MIPCFLCCCSCCCSSLSPIYLYLSQLPSHRQLWATWPILSSAPLTRPSGSSYLCPSNSTKKIYWKGANRLGRLLILVKLRLNSRKQPRTSARAPGEVCGTVKETSDLLPDLAIDSFCRSQSSGTEGFVPMTRNLVVLSSRSSMFLPNRSRPYRLKARWLEMAAHVPVSS